MSTQAKAALAVAFSALVLVWGLVAWRARHSTVTTVQGDLRVGSLRCPGPCRVELTLRDGTRVAASECTLPRALREEPGVRVVAAGKWTEAGVLEASHLFVTARGERSERAVPAGCKTR